MHSKHNLIDAILANSILKTNIVLLRQPEYGEEACRIVRAVQAIFIGIVNSSDIVHIEWCFRRKCRIQDAENPGDMLVEVFYVDVSHNATRNVSERPIIV